MIIDPSYKLELVEEIRRTAESRFTRESKAEILSSNELLEQAAFSFQKDHQDYGCDYDWSLNEALAGLGIDLSQEDQPDVVETPIGNLLIEKSQDADHPGIQVMLEKQAWKTWLATIAYDPADQAIHMDSFGKLYPPDAKK